MDNRNRTILWMVVIVAVAAALPLVHATAFFGTDSFTYTYRDLEMTVTITAGTDPDDATVAVAVRIPDKGSVLIGGVRGTATDVGFPRGRPLRGRLLAMELVGPEGEVREVVVPRAARRPFGARTSARLARGFAQRTGRVIYALYGDFFGLDDM